MATKKTAPTKPIVKKRSTRPVKTTAMRNQVTTAKKQPRKAVMTRTKAAATKKRPVAAQKPIHKQFINAFAVFSLLVFGAIGAIGIVTSSMSHAAGTTVATGPIVGIANKCLDNHARATTNGNKINLWDCNNTIAQQWTLTSDGTLQVQGKCLDVKGNNVATRTLVQLYTCNGTSAQQWTINTATHTITNTRSGLCLDDQWANTGNGNQIWMWHCNGTDAQKWITPIAVDTTPTPTPKPQPTPKPTPTPTPTPAPRVSGVPAWDHVVIAVMENKAVNGIIGNSSAPYITSLARANVNFTQSFGVTHPSQPNYLALFSGSTQGVTSDGSVGPFKGTNLAQQLTSAGKTFTGYSEGLPSTGYTGTSSGGYVKKHNPWVDFPAIPASSNQPFTAFPTDYSKLPTVSFVIPNLNNDMHDGSISQGDVWLKSHLDSYVTWAKTHNSLLIVTFDEDDYASNNHIATVMAGAHQVAGSYSQTIDHYSVLGMIEDAYGLPRSNSSVGKAAITSPWK